MGEPTMNIDNWCDAFPHVAELKRLADSVGRGHYFCCLPAELDVPSSHSLFASIENDLAELDDNAMQAFRNEVVERIPATTDKEHLRQFASLLNEAKGYVFLKREGLTNVFFIPRSKTKQPDVAASVNGADVAVVEVKSVWSSDYESKWIEQNIANVKQNQPPTARPVVMTLPEGLKRKLADDLQKANRQLLEYPAPTECRRIVYFVIYLDSAQQITAEITTQSREYLTGLNVNCGTQIECQFLNAFG